MPSPRADNLQRTAAGARCIQAPVECTLAPGQLLLGRRLERFYFRLVMRRPQVLDAGRTAP